MITTVLKVKGIVTQSVIMIKLVNMLIRVHSVICMMMYVPASMVDAPRTATTMRHRRLLAHMTQSNLQITIVAMHYFAQKSHRIPVR